MANEWRYEDSTGTTGLNLYLFIWSSTNTIWNGSTFVAFNPSNWATYSVPMTGVGGGVYLATMPISLSGAYSATAYKRIGGSPGSEASTDPRQGATPYPMQWDGTSEVVLNSAAASNVKKNQALANFMFVMYDSTTRIPKPSAGVVTATRSLDGAAFAACANAVTEVANGAYKINLAATDLNANVVTLHFTATGCLATILTIITKP